jgi:branched-chain amino acid transport system permease protein
MDHMGSIPIGRLLYPTYNLFVIVIGLIAALGLWWFIYRTKFGVILRATSQDRRMAAALGINVSRVYVQAFAIGCFMAGLGGAVVVPAQAAVLGMGIEALILAFVVVVIGGLGSLEGALVGALIVGLVRTAGIQFFPEIELAVLYLIETAVCSLPDRTVWEGATMSLAVARRVTTLARLLGGRLWLPSQYSLCSRCCRVWSIPTRRCCSPMA